MKHDLFFWIALGITALLLIGGVFVYVQRASLVEAKLDTLDPFQEKALDFFLQRVAVLLTVSTLVCGGAGALLLHVREKKPSSLGPQRWAVAALLAAALSIVFGYLAYDAGIWMLREKFFNLDSVVLKIPANAQLDASLGAVACLVICFLVASRA